MNQMRCIPSLFAVSLLLATLLWSSPAKALQPPAPGEIEDLKVRGKLAEQVAKAKTLGNHLIDPYLVTRAVAKARNNLLRQAGGRAPQAALPAPPPAWQGMPTTGNVKMFVLLIDFSDFPHTASNSLAAVQSAIFGNGSLIPANTAPYESLASYYSRASYGSLDLSGGMTLGWYRPAYSRAAMAQTDDAREQLIMEAINSFNATTDFAQFDNDGNGVIDYFAVVWTGPDNGWSNFWWGYQTSFYRYLGFRVDGKALGKYSWQWEYNDGPIYQGPFSPATLIHETGHALGLPDLYDYDDSIGPDGGVGGLDMMDSGWGDHNSFSKWVMDWISPAVVAGGAQTLTLNPSGTSTDAVLIMSDATSTDPFREFFIAQNRYRIGNDVGYPADGMLLWHVDARLNGSGDDYLYDNSFTDHKLLKLLEADGLERIESSSAWADAAMYYFPGDALTPESQPNSKTYLGEDSRVRVQSIGQAGQEMSAAFSIDETSSLATLQISKPDYGLVTSNPAGIDCGSDCIESLPPGTAVTLTAATTPGVVFDGWSGGVCSGRVACQVAMSGNQTVAANFTTTLLLNEPFSSGSRPVGWSNLSGSQGTWWFNDTRNYTGGSGMYALAAPYGGYTPPVIVDLRTPSLNASAYDNVGLQFKTDVWGLSGGYVDVDVSINGGSTWTNVWHTTADVAGPHTVNLDLSSLAGGQASATIRFRGNAAYLWWSVDDVRVYAATLTPLNDDTEFVRQVYRDFLNREADEAGLNYWVGELAAGNLTRAELVEQYLLSAEFGEKVAPVVRLYFTYFLRLPDYEGLMFWVNAFAAGMTLQQISDEFAASPEFISRYGSLTNEEFVSQMYQNVYGREPDAGGLAFWTGHLDTGNLTRGQVMVEFASAAEYLALSASDVYVTMTYIGLLRRVPDQGGFDYWVGVMDLGASGLALIDSFLESGEYAARFAP